MHVDGFPSHLNEFGVAQLFGDLTITGVSLKGTTALVVFANKFQAYQACELNHKVSFVSFRRQKDQIQALDCRHTLRVTPMSEEVLSQLEIRHEV